MVNWGNHEEIPKSKGLGRREDLMKGMVKTWVGLWVVLLAGVSFASGELDTSFSIDGISTYDFGPWSNPDAGAIAVQGDGKIVVAGFFVLRYTVEGKLDETFYGDSTYRWRPGIIQNPVAMCSQGYTVAIQSDGKIVLAGAFPLSGNCKEPVIAVARLTNDGSFDESFGDHGMVISDMSGGATGLKIQQDGKIVVAASSFTAPAPWYFLKYDSAILRLNMDGTFDDSFAAGGVIVFKCASAEDVAIQPDGKIVVTATKEDYAPEFGAMVLRYNPEGTLDETFDGDGIAFYNPDPSTLHERRSLSFDSLSITQEGIIVAGHSYDKLLLLRYRNDGTLDETFFDTTAAWGMTGQAFSITAEQDGKIVITGTSLGDPRPRDLYGAALFVLRLNNDGTPDHTFAEDGFFIYGGLSITEDGFSRECHGKSIVIQPDGRILVTGNCIDAQCSEGSEGALVCPSYGRTYRLTLRLIGDVYSSLMLRNPNGEQAIASGSMYTIRWGTPPGITSFKLQYTLDNGETWTRIASGLTGSSYAWKVPKPLNNAKKCRVRITGYDVSGRKVASDTSDAPFTIEVVKLKFPNGGEIFTAGSRGSSVRITWVTNAVTRPVNKVAFFLTDPWGLGERRYRKIGSCDGNPGSYTWDVYYWYTRCPYLPFKLKVVLYDKYGNVVGSDATDDEFYILFPD
jgi:uncharacterized delta-60 repeat protein